MLSPEQLSWLEILAGHPLSRDAAAASGGAETNPPGDGAVAGDGADEASSGGGAHRTKKTIAAKPAPPVPRADLGKPQQDRADKLLKEMPDDDQKKVKKLLDDATPDKRKYLTKALASKHTAAELEAFAKEISGMDQKTMDEKLHLVGLSSGKGIKQQWHDSCGPTTVQAMMGELDPIYALKLHNENPDLTAADNSDGAKKNPKMAEEQRKMLEVTGHGSAVSRDQHEGVGAGMDITGLLGDQTPKIGVKFALEGTETDEKMTIAAIIEAASLGTMPRRR